MFNKQNAEMLVKSLWRDEETIREEVYQVVKDELGNWINTSKNLRYLAEDIAVSNRDQSEDSPSYKYEDELEADTRLIFEQLIIQLQHSILRG